MTELFNSSHIEYLKKIKFEKRLKQLEKKLKNKRVAIYGAGAFFQDLCKCYNLQNLNIVAISDRSFNEKGTFMGFTSCPISEITSFSPDYILVGTINFVQIIEDLEQQFDKSIKIRPLIKKPFIDLWKEIWN